MAENGWNDWNGWNCWKWQEIYKQARKAEIYIITTGIGEHRGIGTLKKCTNKNVHHYNRHWGAPWPQYPEKM